MLAHVPNHVMDHMIIVLVTMALHILTPFLSYAVISALAFLFISAKVVAKHINADL